MNIPRSDFTDSYLPAALICFVVALLLFLLPIEDRLGFFSILVSIVVLFVVGAANRRVVPALAVAFVIRCSWALFEYYIFPYVFSTIETDPDGFGAFADYVANDGFANLFSHFQSGAKLSSWFAGVVYLVLGKSVLMIQVYSILAGTLLVVIVYRITTELSNHKSGVIAAWIVALHPSLILFCATFASRETAIIFPLTLSFYFIVKWHKRGKTSDIAIVFLLQSLALASHSGIVVVLLVEIIFFIFQSYRSFFQSKLRRSFGYLLIFFLAIGVVFVINATSWGMEKFGGSLDNVSSDRVITVQSSGGGRAVYLEGLKSNSVFDLVWQSPIRVIYFIFSPFPWMIRSPKHLLGLIDSLSYFYLAFAFLLAWHRIKKKDAALHLTACLFGLLLIFGVAVTNFGTAIRHRAKIAPIAIALVAAEPFRRYTKSDAEEDEDQ